MWTRPVSGNALPTAPILDKQQKWNATNVINGGLDLSNFNGVLVTVSDTGSANTDFTVQHDLNRMPVFYWYISSVAAEVYGTPSTSSVWNNSQITLRCSVGSAEVEVYVI